MTVSAVGKSLTRTRNIGEVPDVGVLLSHLIPTRMEAPTSISRRAARRPLILVFIAAAMPLALFAGWVVFLNAQQQRRGLSGGRGGDAR